MWVCSLLLARLCACPRVLWLLARNTTLHVQPESVHTPSPLPARCICMRVHVPASRLCGALHCGRLPHL